LNLLGELAFFGARIAEGNVRVDFGDRSP